jgi:hypothetical protein
MTPGSRAREKTRSRLRSTIPMRQADGQIRGLEPRKQRAPTASGRMWRRINAGVTVASIGTLAKRYAGLLSVTAVLLVVPSGAEATAPPPCDPGLPPALEFAGLPSRIVTGPDETFGFGRTFASERSPGDPFIVRMENARGHPFFEGALDSWRDRLYIGFRLDHGPALVTLYYHEVDPASAERCGRTIARRVRPKRLVLFPPACQAHYRGLRQRPRSVLVACGDGNLQLRSMRWRGWNSGKARGRGQALLNDCRPYCAAGRFHRLPVRVRLTRPQYCSGLGRYIYTRLSYRYLRRPSWLARATGSAPFPCRFVASEF